MYIYIGIKDKRDLIVIKHCDDFRQNDFVILSYFNWKARLLSNEEW